MITDFQAEVYELASRVPKGKVTTYKAIADAIAKKRGKPMSYRAVGQALNKNPFIDVPCHRVVSAAGTIGGWTPAEERVPCHRVVSATGRVGGFVYGMNSKVAKLAQEGVKVEDGRIVNFKKVVVTKF